MKRFSMPLAVLLAFAFVFASLAATTVPARAQQAPAEPAHDHATHDHSADPAAAPGDESHKEDHPDKVDKQEKCLEKGLKKVREDMKHCTHGPDPAPEGYDIGTPVPPVVEGEGQVTAAALECSGDGISGPRVQVLYARASDRPDRYATYLASFLQWAADADEIYEQSAVETGGSRHIRFVHDAGCQPIIPHVVVSPSGDDTFGNTIAELGAQGYNRHDRKYMIFMDATILCGIGTRWNDDADVWDNLNNTGVSYGRTDAGCWGGFTVAHELMHNLGAVQNTAPNTSYNRPNGNPGGHCIDEGDVMCYSDYGPGQPPMQDVCANHSDRFDCNHDDYYHTDPPAENYLATHWNAADNAFLIGGMTVTCPDFYLWEPDDFVNWGNDFVVGTTQSHAFCTTGDWDWVNLAATAGTQYRLETLNLAAVTDTILDIFSYDPSSEDYTLLDSDDDSGGDRQSLLLFTPKTSETFYVRARQFDGGGSDAHTYDLQISLAQAPDTTAPVTTAAANPALNAAGWSYRNVTVTLSAVDESGGSGVASVTYRAEGAHPLAPKTVSGATASFVIWKPGETTVTFSATDDAGNVAPEQTFVVKLDKTSPVCSGPTTSFTAPALSSTTANVPVEVGWACTDATSGIDRYLVQRSTNGGVSWSGFSGYTTATSKTADLVPGTSYLFRVRAYDVAGRASAWAVSAPVTVALTQEPPSGNVVYSGTWTSGSFTWASGGTVHSSKIAGHAATLTFTGREVAWIAPKHRYYGIANIYLDNVLVGQVDLYAAAFQMRQVVFHQAVSAGTHTLRIEVTGTRNAAALGAHIYVDAFVVVS
jgi:hypothetical protein